MKLYAGIVVTWLVMMGFTPSYSLAQSVPNDAAAVPAAEKSDILAANKAAEEKFNQAEIIFKKLIATTLQNPNGKTNDKYLHSQMSKMSDLIFEAKPLYEDVIKYGRSPKLGIASLVRIGMMHQHVSDELNQAKPPQELAETVIAQYMELIHDFSSQFEERAIHYYELAIEKKNVVEADNEFIREAQSRMQSLKKPETQNDVQLQNK